MTEDSIKRKVNNAIEILKISDRFLIDHRLHEQTLSHRLAVCLENLFPREFQIDCEYNKKVDAQQATRPEAKSPSKKTPRGVRPDIIIHKRGKNGSIANLLVIQLKRKENPRGVNNDKSVLRRLTRQKGKYQYQLGLFLEIDNDTGDIEQKWFKNGKEETNT